MRFAWFRWRLAVVAIAVGLILPIVSVTQALQRAQQLRALDPVAGDYLRQATFGGDTLVALAVWTAEVALVVYLAGLGCLYLSHCRQKRGAA